VSLPVYWSSAAREHVLAITQYIARSSPVYAERWSDRVLSRTEQLALFPESGRPVPEANSQTSASCWKAHRLAVVAGGGHMVNLIEPDRYNATIIGFLTGVIPPGARR
jgi:plasmid stabilization system protein ParE